MCFTDCSVVRGLLWSSNEVTELPPLPDGKYLSSIPSAVNPFGWAVGQAQNGRIDAATQWPETRAVLWPNKGIRDLGSLGGTQGIANSINILGQVVGASATGTLDPFANSPLSSCIVLLGVFCNSSSFSSIALFYPVTTETHAFLWQGESMRDLGTLGGPDSNAWMINDRGEVAGYSFTSFTPNASTGVPTVEPFFWSASDGMIPIGSLGGTFGGPWWINNNGQVTGSSNLAGDQTEHPFIWSKTTGMKDLGTLGGSFAHPDAMNDAGDVVGFSFIAGDQIGHAFLWRGGVMTDLGALPTLPDTEALSINSKGQVVGGDAFQDTYGFLWENDGPIVLLNDLVLPGTNLSVTSGVAINDEGEIACIGTLPNGNSHPCILIPCDENHPRIAGCDYSLVETRATTYTNPSDFPYVIPNISNTPLIEPFKVPPPTGGRCTREGMECPPQWPPCCPGLTCVPESTRAFCLRI
jgi:probable HAF family extracellular repeat protein